MLLSFFYYYLFKNHNDITSNLKCDIKNKCIMNNHPLTKCRMKAMRNLSVTLICLCVWREREKERKAVHAFKESLPELNNIETDTKL